jgi:hypothetical protein
MMRSSSNNAVLKEHNVKKRYSLRFGKLHILVPVITILLLKIMVLSAFSGTIERVSFSSSGAQGNSHSGGGSISADGRYVAFASSATNLVPNDTNFYDDIFVRDRVTGETTRINLGLDGAQANGSSGHAVISADGRYVAFESWAGNLVPDDTNGTWDIFVYDRENGSMTRVSVSSAGAQGNSASHSPCISATGRFIAFESSAALSASDRTYWSDVYVHDLLTGETSLVSVTSAGVQGNDEAVGAFISGDGRYVGFTSYASDLVFGDTNGAPDIFVHDRLTNETLRVSVASDGTQANTGAGLGSISMDGHFTVFSSYSNNLVSGDTGTTNGNYGSGDDVFVHDMITGETTRVSVDPDGLQLNYGAYMGSVGDVFSSISADGRYVTFLSWASNVVPGDTNGTQDAFVRDRTLGKTVMLSAAADGTPGNGQTYAPYISADGRSVVFGSSAENLIGNDTNMRSDVFVSTLTVTAAPFVVASPSFLKYDRVALSQHDSRTISILNIGSAALTFGTLAIGGNDPSEFTLPSDTCSGQELLPASSCSVEIRFSPVSPMSRSAVLTVPSNAPNNSLMQLSLSGMGGPSPDPFLYVSRPDIDFADVVVSTVSSAQSLTISNAGTGDLILGTLSLEGAHASQFRVLSETCSGRTLASGAGCTVQAQFQPDSLGARSCVLSIHSNGANNVVTQVALTGTSVVPRPAAVETTIRASVATDGSQGNDWSYHPALSADGRFVVFESKATNLVPGDTNLAPDFFVRDLLTGTTSRVSIASDGAQAIAPPNTWPWSSLSADGRYAAFTSEAVNLVENDGNVEKDIFVHDRQTGTTVRASVSSAGAEANDMAYMPRLSRNGKLVAFQSAATNLVFPQTTQWTANIYVRNLDTAQTILVSKATDSTYGNSSSNDPSISSDGRYIAFDSLATNLVPGDTNKSPDPNYAGTGRDVFVHDLQTGVTTRVSVASDGSQANGNSQYPSISGDGRYVAFESSSTNFGATIPVGTGQIFLRDRVSGTTALISKNSNGDPADNDSQYPSISTDGRYVEFTSRATNLGGSGFAIYVHDCVTGETRWVSKSFDGGSGNGWASTPLSPAIISADGRTVAFYSNGDNFAENDTNGTNDIFIHNLGDASLSIWPASFSFDTMPAGSSPLVKTFTLTNTNSLNMTLGTLYLGGRDSRSFQKQADGCSGKILSSGESCTVDVRFSAVAAGTKDARLMIPSFIETFSLGTASLTGTGYAGLSVSPRLLSFGTTTVADASSPKPVAVFNTGSQETSITTALGGLHASDFTIVDDQCSGHTLASRETCTVQITFVPASAGALAAVFTVQSNGQAGSALNVSLAGVGTTDLAGALDNPVQIDGSTPLIFTPDLAAAWSAVTTTLYDDTSGTAARSGSMTGGGHSSLRTTVTGPFSVTFYQKVSSQARYDLLTFSIDGAVKSKLSGEVNWQQKGFTVKTAGTHTLVWTYLKNPSLSKGQDAAWLDRVVVSPNTKVTLLTQNSGGVVSGGTATNISWSAPANADKFKLLFSINNGMTWKPITADYVTGTNYVWNVPAQNKDITGTRVKVVAFTAADDIAGSDASDKPFMIEVLKVASPNVQRP